MSHVEILITGLGVISAAGETCDETLSSFKSSTRNVGEVSLFETSIAKPVFEVENIPGRWRRPGMRTLSLALTAIDEAMAEAGLGADAIDLRIGVCMGTTVASQLNDIDFYRAYRTTGKGPKEAVDRYTSGNLAAAVKKEFSFCGPDLTVVNACSSGTDAIGIALGWIKAGLCDIAVAGGADELNRVPLAGFNSLGILSDAPCSPFDKNRTGLNLGEGAGAVVLENAESAEKRGASSALRCMGYGTYADAYHLTAPRPDGSGLEKAIRKALAEAGRAPDDISFVNTHGTATANNDLVEGTTLARILGKDIKIYSTKGYTGHALGAAGAIEAVFTALALKNGWIPKSAGFFDKDDDIPLAPVSDLTDVAATCALSTSLAFGGNNSALVLEKLA
jgi:3-oxoacyl-[acyl-carrier-protein] synthase II